jgi:subtilisin family serine protease
MMLTAHRGETFGDTHMARNRARSQRAVIAQPVIGRRRMRRIVCLFAVAAGLMGVLAPAAEAALPPSEVQAQQWWIARLGLQEAWKITKGQGVTVAVIDSGVDARFGDLQGAVTSGFGVRVSGNGQRDTDPAYHGTRMADVIAGRGSGFGLLGVAPQATILPVAFDNARDGGNSEDTTEVLTKLTAMTNPPDVVNMSFGKEGPCPAALQSAVTAATAKGMILVASAGNTPSENLNPANCTGVIAVGASDENLQPWENTALQPYVALSGPGVRMIGYSTSAPSGYGYAAGTSDSAAVVSGTFALARAKFPNATPRDLVARVLYTARQFVGAQGTRNDTWGYGLARPRHALTDAVPATAPNPIYDALEKLSTPSPSSSAVPTNGTLGSSSSPTGTAQATEADKGGGSSTGLVIGVVVVVLVVAALIVILVLRARRRTPTG